MCVSRTQPTVGFNGMREGCKVATALKYLMLPAIDPWTVETPGESTPNRCVKTHRHRNHPPIPLVVFASAISSSNKPHDGSICMVSKC